MARQPKTAPTIDVGEPTEGWTFSSYSDVMMLPLPTKGRGVIDYPHASETGFFVRVAPMTKKGAVKRSWVHRYRTKTEGSQKPSFAEVGKESEKGFLSYSDALDTFRELRRAVFLPASKQSSKRLTVGAAWEKHAGEGRLRRDRTSETEEHNYSRYLAHIADRELEDLDYDYWQKFIELLEHGRLVVGRRMDGQGKDVPQTRGPLGTATLRSVMNTVCNLYSTAVKHKGVSPGHDGAALARQQIGTVRARTSHIKLEHVGAAWRAADVWCWSWARDQFRLYLLTGLRYSLLTELRFNEVDWKERCLLISAHKTGTKRRRKDLVAGDEELLKLPLSGAAYDLLRARHEWATDKSGPVWYAVRPVRGNASRGPGNPAPPNKDARSNWDYLQEHALDGEHFAPHDLRRTFATIGLRCKTDLVGVSLLLLHSGQTVADAAKVPGITVQYMNQAEGQARMREAAHDIATWIEAQATTWTAQAFVEQPLPAMLEAAVADDNDVLQAA